MSNNTFGDYCFPKWVPEDVQKQIRDFWGCFGRTYKDWLNNPDYKGRDFCYHGPNPNGFGNPPYGAKATYILRGGKEVTGRYIHAWNNIGRLITTSGKVYCVSSCDMWVRIFRNKTEKNNVISKYKLTLDK